MRATRKGDSTSEPPATPVGVSSYNNCGEAVKAAVQVVRDEFQKHYDDMIERLELLEGRLDAVESTVADTVSQGRTATTTSTTAIVELTAKLEAVRGETRQTAILAQPTKRS